MPALKLDEGLDSHVSLHCLCGDVRNEFRRETEPLRSNKLNEALLNLFASAEQKRGASGCLLVEFSLRAPFLHPGVYSPLTAWLDFSFKYLISDCLLWHRRRHGRTHLRIFSLCFVQVEKQSKQNSRDLRMKLQ